MRGPLVLVLSVAAICIANVASAQEIAEWPTVAVNQTETVIDTLIESSPDTILVCDPCWDVCQGWVSVANSVCRSEEVGQDCTGSSGYQWCVWKVLVTGLRTCKTCIN